MWVFKSMWVSVCKCVVLIYYVCVHVMCALKGSWNSVKKPRAKLLVTTAAQCHPHLQATARNKAGMRWCFQAAVQDKAVYWKQLHPPQPSCPELFQNWPELSRTSPNGSMVSQTVPERLELCCFTACLMQNCYNNNNNLYLYSIFLNKVTRCLYK